MTAARALVEHAAHGSSEHTYGVNTGFGRFVSRVDPRRADRGAAAAPAPQPRVRRRRALPARGRARGDAAPRERAREGLLGRPRRDGRAADRVPQPRACCRTCPPRLGRRERRPRAARAPRAAARRRGRGWFDGERLPGAEALARAGLEPIRLAAKEGLSLINGTQFMAAMAALALVRARRLAQTADIACALSLEALQGSRTSFLPQIHALRPLRGQVDSAANVLRLLEGSAIIESHRWCDKVQDAYSLRCAPQVHGASPRPARLRRGDGRGRAERRDRQPARARRATSCSSRTATSTASRSRSRSTRWRWRSPSWRASPSGASSGSSTRLSERAAAVPDRRRRPQLRLHDPAVRRRGARLREQVALPSGERRLDPDERRPGGSRLDGERRRA